MLILVLIALTSCVTGIEYAIKTTIEQSQIPGTGPIPVGQPHDERSTTCGERIGVYMQHWTTANEAAKWRAIQRVGVWEEIDGQVKRESPHVTLWLVGGLPPAKSFAEVFAKRAVVWDARRFWIDGVELTPQDFYTRYPTLCDLVKERTVTR